MEKKKLKEYEKRLLEKHAELTQEYARSKEESLGDQDEGTEDFVDFAVKAYTKEFLLSLSDMERRELQQVEEALARLRRGEFGQCGECEKPIGEKRLKAIPWTPLCIQCQEQHERQPTGASSGEEL